MGQAGQCDNGIVLDSEPDQLLGPGERSAGTIRPEPYYGCFFFSSRRRHTRSVSAFLLNRSSDLLEEILSFRMQGVEFDNGDMYVDGHKAASDVRDEFVSVTEKLMDELAQCYNVLPQLDINNTIDHRPEGDEKWFLE